MKNLKFNPSSMQFEKDYSKPIIIMLVTFLVMALIFILLNDKPQNEVLYQNEKIMQEKSPIELDTTVQRYHNDVAFRAIVKACEIRYNKYLKDSTIKANFKH